MAAHGTLTSYSHGCRCAPCGVAARAYNVAFRRRRIDAGLCPRCGQQVGPLSSVQLCFPCRQRQSVVMREHRKRLREGPLPSPGPTFQPEHHQDSGVFE